jgi:hypothetical protein
MYRYIQCFGGRYDGNWNFKSLIVVAHLARVHAFTTAYSEATIARNAGADGVFIIDMNNLIVGDELVKLADEVAKRLPGFFVGINDLDANDPAETIERVAGKNIQGVWSDRTGNRELIEAARQKSGWDGILYSGILFKYTAGFYAPDSAIPEIVSDALPYVDVPTTSGKGTGVEADLSRLRLIREAAGPEAFLAVASGTSARNVLPQLEYVDSVLASSSLVDENDRLIPTNVRDMADVIHGYSK